MENRRTSDAEIATVILRVEKLEQEVHQLRNELESHKQLDEQTHEKMMLEMALVQNKIDTIMKELIAHTKAEEDKFDRIIRNQEQHKVELAKLTTDTAPAIALTNTGKYLGLFVKFIKDTMAPLLIGGAIMYGFVYDRLPISFQSTTTTTERIK